MLKVTWYGHAAFKLESPELSLILDPYQYPAAGGYLPINDSADAVLISHINDRYHSHTGQITPGFELLKPEAVLALDEALERHNATLPRLQEFI